MIVNAGPAEDTAGADAGAKITVTVVATGTPLRVTAREVYVTGDTITLGIRAERIAVTPPGGGEPGATGALPARLVRRLYSGAAYEYELDCGGHRLVAEDTVLDDREQVWLSVPGDRVYTFTGDRTGEVGEGAGLAVEKCAADPG